ncbi:MAG: hypothetical protein EOO40_00680, partial [Deltaproteobacteria bacterium]
MDALHGQTNASACLVAALDSVTQVAAVLRDLLNNPSRVPHAEPARSSGQAHRLRHRQIAAALRAYLGGRTLAPPGAPQPRMTAAIAEPQAFVPAHLEARRGGSPKAAAGRRHADEGDDQAALAALRRAVQLQPAQPLYRYM